MKYIFLDLEMNQGFSTHKITMSSNTECPLEVIEIGAVKLNENFDIVDTFSSLIQPYVYNKLSPKIKRLTGIKENQLRNAPRFRDVMWDFTRWLEKNDEDMEEYIIYVWGDSDLSVLEHNFTYRKMWKMSWLFLIIDLQEKISIIYKNKFKKDKIALSEMMNYYKIEIQEDKPLHRALNDAEYLAMIFKIAFKRLGLKNSLKLFE